MPGTTPVSELSGVRGTGTDTNGNRTVTGRVGLVYNSDFDFELGVSGSTGELRAGPTGVAATAEDFEASFTAFGPDLTIGYQGLGLKSYYYTSTEDLTGTRDIDRSGFTVEPSYTLHRRGASKFREVTLLTRLSRAEEDDIAGNTYTRTQFGVGLNTRITKTFVGKISFVSQGEDDHLPDQDNNALSISITSEF